MSARILRRAVTAIRRYRLMHASIIYVPTLVSIQSNGTETCRQIPHSVREDINPHCGARVPLEDSSERRNPFHLWQSWSTPRIAKYLARHSSPSDRDSSQNARSSSGEVAILGLQLIGLWNYEPQRIACAGNQESGSLPLARLPLNQCQSPIAVRTTKSLFILVLLSTDCEGQQDA